MTEQVAHPPRRVGPLPAAALLGGLAVAWLLAPQGFASPPSQPARSHELHLLIGRLPHDSLVLVDIDADLGTYPEIRYATRAALADLVAGGARLAVVSVSPEGRAVAAAEIARLRALGMTDERLLDLGYRSGAEAALVQLAGSGIGPQPAGPVAEAIRARYGLEAFALALVVGGADIGPRTWVEQVEPRVPNLQVAAITPGMLLPEVQPYRDSGQLVAVADTLPSGVAYGNEVAAGGTGGAAAFTERPLSGLAMGLGMLAAVVFLALSAAGTLATWIRRETRHRT
jgi:hypothetical protein